MDAMEAIARRFDWLRRICRNQAINNKKGGFGSIALTTANSQTESESTTIQ